MYESWFNIPRLEWPIGVTGKWEIQFGTDFHGWALPFGLSAGQCDFNHATCITLQFLCLYVTLMIYRNVR